MLVIASTSCNHRVNRSFYSTGMGWLSLGPCEWGDCFPKHPIVWRCFHEPASLYSPLCFVFIFYCHSIFTSNEFCSDVSFDMGLMLVLRFGCRKCLPFLEVEWWIALFFNWRMQCDRYSLAEMISTDFHQKFYTTTTTTDDNDGFDICAVDLCQLKKHCADGVTWPSSPSFIIIWSEPDQYNFQWETISIVRWNIQKTSHAAISNKCL